MIDSYRRVFTNYANFSGRSGRAEYWWFALTIYVLSAVFYGITLVLIPMLGYFALTPLILLAIATTIPYLAVTVRRLHDTNRSAWWLLLWLIPYIGAIILLVLMAFKTHPHSNKWGVPASG